MSDTAYITNIADEIDPTPYMTLGDPGVDKRIIANYDVDSIRTEYAARLNKVLPRGVTLAANGDVYAIAEVVDEARAIDWSAFLDAHEDDADLLDIINGQARGLINDVAEWTRLAAMYEQKRVDAIFAAKKSGLFTVEEIAHAAKITRDGVYKILTRIED